MTGFDGDGPPGEVGDTFAAQVAHVSAVAAAAKFGSGPGGLQPQPTTGHSLNLADLRAVNTVRCARWHVPGTVPWTGADWSNAMCGEAGEAANVVKKIRRHETGTGSAANPPLDTLVAKLAEEIADTVIYAYLLAAHYGIDLAAAVVAKFNKVSVREGFPERLGNGQVSDA